jgi:peptide/nickel transport system permease protein
VPPSLVVGVLVVAAFLAMALAAPLLSPVEDGARQGYRASLEPEPPGPEHPLGALPGGVDVLHGLVWGSRAVLRVGLAVVMGRVLLGIVVGLAAGYAGRLVDGILMRITDGFLAFPMVAAALVLLSLLDVGSGSSGTALFARVSARQEQIVQVALILFGWMAYARLMRGNVLVEREKEYMLAARAGGVGRRRLLVRHLLPNSTQGLLVMAASDVGGVVVTLLAFAFIGLIGSSSDSLKAGDWGQMLAAARYWVVGGTSRPFAYWYTYLPLSLAVVLYAAGWNLIGDGLRDALDPRMR